MGHSRRFGCVSAISGLPLTADIYASICRYAAPQHHVSCFDRRSFVFLSILSVCLLSSNRVLYATHKCWHLKAPCVASREPSEAATLTDYVSNIAQVILAKWREDWITGIAFETLAGTAAQAAC